VHFAFIEFCILRSSSAAVAAASSSSSWFPHILLVQFNRLVGTAYIGVSLAKEREREREGEKIIEQFFRV
jgi:hypothetical protein